MDNKTLEQKYSDAVDKNVEAAEKYSQLADKYVDEKQRVFALEAELNQIKSEHEKWCPHFHVKYQEMIQGRDVLRDTSAKHVAEIEKLRHVAEQMAGALDACQDSLRLIYHRHSDDIRTAKLASGNAHTASEALTAWTDFKK